MASGPLPPDDVLRAWLSGSVGDDAVAPDTKPTRHQLLRDDQSRQQEMDRIEQIVRSEMARKAGGNDAKRSEQDAEMDRIEQLLQKEMAEKARFRGEQLEAQKQLDAAVKVMSSALSTVPDAGSPPATVFDHQAEHFDKLVKALETAEDPEAILQQLNDGSPRPQIRKQDQDALKELDKVVGALTSGGMMRGGGLTSSEAQAELHRVQASIAAEMDAHIKERRGESQKALDEVVRALKAEMGGGQEEAGWEGRPAPDSEASRIAEMELDKYIEAYKAEHRATSRRRMSPSPTVAEPVEGTRTLGTRGSSTAPRATSVTDQVAVTIDLREPTSLPVALLIFQGGLNHSVKLLMERSPQPTMSLDRQTPIAQGHLTIARTLAAAFPTHVGSFYPAASPHLLAVVDEAVEAVRELTPLSSDIVRLLSRKRKSTSGAKGPSSLMGRLLWPLQGNGVQEQSDAEAKRVVVSVVRTLRSTNDRFYNVGNGQFLCTLSPTLGDCIVTSAVKVLTECGFDLRALGAHKVERAYRTAESSTAFKESIASFSAPDTDRALLRSLVQEVLDEI